MEENANQKWVREFYSKIARYLHDEGIAIRIDNVEAILEATMRPRMKEKLGGKRVFDCLEERGRACHADIDEKDICCLVCACPNYLNNDLAGGCRIRSKKGKWFYHEGIPGGRVWDCTDCGFGHSKDYARKWLRQSLDYLASIDF